MTVSSLVQRWQGLLLQAEQCGSSAHYKKYLETFLRGGRDTLLASLSQTAWVQRSLAPVETEFSAAVFGELHEFVTAALQEGLIENFFFMRKSPGLRLRFEASIDAPDLSNRVDRNLLAWCHRGLAIKGPQGIYEPEDQLFGGPDSMPYVEAIFTIDSLLWLDFFGKAQLDHRVDSDPWTTSFAFLRALFDGLAIVGWEDRGVWAVIARDMGRNLPKELRDKDEYVDLADEVRDRWKAANRMRENAQGSGSADQYDAVRQAAARWEQAYFRSPDARIGPRQAAAYMTIFHWNRAGLPAFQQALISEALAQRDGDKTASQRGM